MAAAVVDATNMTSHKDEYSSVSENLIRMKKIAPVLLGIAGAAPFFITPAQADTAPERAMIGFKYLDYQDRQPGLERISVRAPATLLVLPINEDWSISGTYTVDTVSGASPRYHSEVSSASRMHDVRKASDMSVTRYFPTASVRLGTALSRESDYVSKVVSLNGSISSEDKNTTLNAGISATRDQINPSNEIVVDEKKSVIDLMLGITQVVSMHDIVQLNLTHSAGQGYYSDPYKFFDNRPRNKTINALLLRWNHHIDRTDGTSRLGYRYYTDSFGIKSHTLTAEYVQPLQDAWTITPQLRLYTQTAANFYYGTVNPPDPTIPDGFQPGVTLLSEDQRLAAFGGRSIGIKLAKWFTADLLVDIKYEHYQQKSDWCMNGQGSSGIAPFSASIAQLGLSYFF